MKKNVLITGASGNLGKAVVARFLADGHQVIITVTPGKKSAVKSSENLVVYEADLTNETQTHAVVTEIVSKFGKIDMAVLLVGGFAAGGIDAADGTAIKKMFSLNFDTAYFVARPVFQHMMASRIEGRIVLIGSRPSLYPNEGKDYLAYSLSKSMLFKLAEFLNATGGSHNIVTSVVVPGTIDTPDNRTSMPDADFAKWVTSEEIAGAIAFLCGDEAKPLREPLLKLFGRK